MKIHSFDIEYSAGLYWKIENTPQIWLMQCIRDTGDRLAEKMIYAPFVALVEKHFWGKPHRRKPVGLISYWMKHEDLASQGQRGWTRTAMWYASGRECLSR